MGRYTPPPYWPEGQQGESVEPKELRKRERKLVCEFLETAVNDTEARPDLMPDFVKGKDGQDENNSYKKIRTMNKETAIWFTFNSRGVQSLKWWCDIVKISHLKYRRGITEILEGQE